MKSWNPYYLAYCAAHGNTPERQLEVDAERYPGGKMAGFILWMDQRKQEFAKLQGWRGSADELDFLHGLYLCGPARHDYQEFLNRRAAEGAVE